MSNFINRFLKKSEAPLSEEGSSDQYVDFLAHFYNQGFNSDKLDEIKKKVKKTSLSADENTAQFQLVHLYLTIENYLLVYDAGFLGSRSSLRNELSSTFPEIASTPPFKVLEVQDRVQEIKLAYTFALYCFDKATTLVNYFSILSPEFTIKKEIDYSLLKEDMVHYLSCRRKIREYIEQLHVEITSKTIKNSTTYPYEEWCNDFQNYFEHLETVDKITYYIPEKVVEKKATTVSTQITAPTQKEAPAITTSQDQEGSTLLFSALENMLDKAIIFDSSGKILYGNYKARKVFQLKDLEANPKNIYDLLPPSIGLQLQRDIEDIAYSHDKEVLGLRRDITITTADGKSEYFEISTSNNFSENTDTYSIFLKNITKKKDTLETINKEMEHAQRAAKAKATFLSNMSHEIRTPLNVILGLADIISKSDNEDPELFKKNIEGIDFSAKNLLSIVNDILDFSKIEAGKLSIQSYDFNIRKVIISLANGFASKANEKGVEVQTLIDPKVPDIVIGDQFRINQILTNLIGNAIKFTNEGKIEIIVNAIATDEENIDISFEVKDTGIGISEDKINSIFDSFYQVEETENSKVGGTGLGLAITKELINLQHGTLTASSTLGVGSSFCFTIPLLKSKLQSTEETVKTRTSNDKQLQGLKVLVAEDNTMNQFYISQLLNRLGIDVAMASNGQEAVEIYKNAPKGYYNLILMDMHMPILGGIEAISAIRESRKYALKKTPIVICSADVFPESRKEAIKAGIDFYLTKPLEEDALKEVLYWLISNEDLYDLESSTTSDKSLSSVVNMSKLRETFDNDEEFIISLLEVFIADTPSDYKSLITCMERGFYQRASGLAHKIKSSFMNLGMTQQGYILQQIEKHTTPSGTIETAQKYVEQLQQIYTKSLLDVNIILIELKRG
ncbi:ATP-binding protein [Dokdonia sp. PRO95]|uniref:ATP-binding protein n=1 Tax=Dokdonia sp. PRO95 TaxID=1239415 RepID=UPI00068B6FDE|nr:ATP-binding protein [Dokdonia sp. PRO95]